MALLAPGAAGARTQGFTYDQAVDQLIADGYPQAIETYLNSLVANPLGIRLASTEAEQGASRYLAGELKAVGLSNVRLEPVPVDAYEFGGASVARGRHLRQPRLRTRRPVETAPLRASDHASPCGYRLAAIRCPAASSWL